MSGDDDRMSDSFLDVQVSIRAMLMLAFGVAVPYLIVGVVWVITHADHLGELQGLDQVFSFIGEIVAWPPLVISDITLR